MATLVCFPDTTVLVNFGLIKRVDLLELLLKDPRWCLTVSRECKQSFGVLGLTSYPAVRALFGDPVLPSQAEMIDASALRDQMASPDDKPSAHSGEAETITVAKRRFAKVIFATDDLGAAAAARREGIAAVNTWQLLRAAMHKGFIDEDQAWAAAVTLRANARGWIKGVGPSRTEFLAWLRTSV